MDHDEQEITKALNEVGTEDITDEELQVLVLDAQREALQADKVTNKTKRRFPKWIFWLLTVLLVFNMFSFVFQIYSIPAMDFLKTSAKLSADEQIGTYAKSVVTITTGESKGTGFSTASNGVILTNYHVVEGYNRVTVAFPKDGRYVAKVVNTFPEIDLAVLEIDGKDLPHLKLAKDPPFSKNERIQFIGNPLSFEGIANEGTVIDTLRLNDWDVDVVMIDAPVYRGNSGSPVLNTNGQVIGVIFATLEHPEYRKVGLFIPIDRYYDAMDRNQEK